MLEQIGKAARAAAQVLATASAERKHAALIGAAEAVWDRRADILAANASDMEAGRQKGLAPAMLDRLRLDEDRLRGIIDGLRSIAEMHDPVGAELAAWTRPNGLKIRRVRTPIGVIGVIFESRPNVTIDAGALCLKSGNAAILRPGSEAYDSAAALHRALVSGLGAAGLPEAGIQLVPTRDRAAVGEMLGMTDSIDVIVPRGGKSLVARVQKEARVPVFAHLEGIVHIYVHASADPEMVRKVVLNAKMRRTGICGAAECLLIDRSWPEAARTALIETLLAAGVELRGDAALQQVGGVVPAQTSDWGHEYLDAIMAARLVEDLDAALAHIRTYHSGHTDAILAEDPDAVARFFNELDSAILMHNASTQFADGGEFGMGAEIGIATGKIHARGPVGAEQLTSFKYLVTADGAVRS